jgi:hypothetical protein
MTIYIRRTECMKGGGVTAKELARTGGKGVLLGVPQGGQRHSVILQATGERYSAPQQG